jgi:hypothetical protein
MLNESQLEFFLQPNFSTLMKQSLFLACFVCMMATQLGAQDRVTLNGYLKDAQTGEVLIGASVYIKPSGPGAYTNEYGFYALSVPPGNYEVVYSYLGYVDQIIPVGLNGNIAKTIEMTPEGFTTSQEAVVLGEAADEQVKQVEMSVNKLSVQEIKQIAQFMGEVDIIRSIQLLPGVSTVGEGATGFNVRGGNIDQNLILLDEAPVYNSSHLFGFFSVFNADALKDVKLYKGGIPAQYGGRLSSVLDVRQKDGNTKRFSGQGGIGTISSRLTLEGPIVKDKMSFMVSGRRSYADVFLPLFPDTTVNSSTLYFYDLNGKLNYTINDKNRIYLSGYFGKDVFGFGEDFTFKWGNTTGTARWNHLFTEKLFSNFSFIYSDYNYEIGIPEGEQAFTWQSRIQTRQGKADFGWFANPNNTIKFGAEAIFYTFRPGDVDFKDDGSIFGDFTIPKEYSREFAAYVANEQKISDKLTFQYGLRYSYFQNVGEQDIFLYPNGTPTESSDIIDTVSYSSGELIADYGGLEPRFAANYLLSPGSSVKASYNRMRQYIHLISNTTAATPVDVWKPAGKYVKPAIADQVALGYFKNFSDNMYELSVETYYKNFQDLVDYEDGAELLFNRSVETELLSGKGRAYGLELMLNKQRGRLTGWVSYTLSRTERQVDGINNSDYYPSNFDKTHDLEIVGVFKLTDRWLLSSNFAFQTGRPITYPNARAEWNGITYPVYDNRNGARTPAYHRLDVAADYTFRKKKPDTRWGHSLNISVYNLYARRNPYSIYFKQNDDNPTLTEAHRLAIFGTLIPSVTYNFKF